MKIKSSEAIPVAAAFKSTFRFGTTDRTTSPNVVVIIRTDDGAVGYGEACPVPAFTSETQRSIVELVEQRVAPLFAGRNPEHRLPLLRDLSRVLKSAPFTVGAVDTALLDLMGRALGVPVYSRPRRCAGRPGDRVHRRRASTAQPRRPRARLTGTHHAIASGGPP